MSPQRARKAAADTESENGHIPLPAPVMPVLRSPYALMHWEFDRPVPAGRSREIASSFCGALLRHLGSAVDEIIVRDRLAVLVLPRLPVPARAEADAIGLLVPREQEEENGEALQGAAHAVGQEGFNVGGRELRLRSVTSLTNQHNRWMGPSRVWTSVTPWVSERDHAGKFAEHRQSCLRESLGLSLLGSRDSTDRQLAIEGLVQEAQAHDEAWVQGILPASQSPEFRPGPPTHVRVTFSGAVEGPIVIGRDRLFGMGLLAPVGLPTAPLE